MRRSIAWIILMAFTIVSVASLMMRSARADVVVFTAQLFASNEVPPISNADSTATGFVTVTVDTATNLYRFDWSVAGVASPVIILSHIHEAPAGVNGPVRVDSGISPGAPIPVVSGTAVFNRAGLVGPADVTTRLLANPAGFYFNIHSSLNPGGVVRGQLVRQTATSPGTAAPTLSEWGAILMGLLIIAASVFFLVGRRKASMEFAAAASSVSLEGPVRSIDWKLLAKVTLVVEAVTSIVLVALSAGVTDVVGALTSGVLVAFIVHVFIAASRRR
jgi:CHRD domain-containing protein